MSTGGILKRQFQEPRLFIFLCFFPECPILAAAALAIISMTQPGVKGREGTSSISSFHQKNIPSQNLQLVFISIS